MIKSILKINSSDFEIKDCLKLRFHSEKNVSMQDLIIIEFTEYPSHARHFARYFSIMMSSYLMIDTDKQTITKMS